MILKGSLILDLEFGSKEYMKLKIVIIGFLFWSLGFAQAPDTFTKKVKKQVYSTFDIEQFDAKSVVIDQNIADELPAKFTEQNFFKIYSNQQFLGYAYFGIAMGKVDSFDYLILFDTELIIANTKVLKYREDYGGEITSKRWLRQFNGKSSQTQLSYGENVAAISGATISVKAMTYSMNTVLKSIALLQEKNIL